MSRKIIAWVEDDIDILEPVVAPLRLDGFSFLEYRSYADALEHIDEIQRCDLLLLDLVLPPGRALASTTPKGTYLGVELLRQLRSLNVTAPAVFFSVVAHYTGLTYDQLDALDVTLLSKPVRPSVLKAHIYERLDLNDVGQG